MCRRRQTMTGNRSRSEWGAAFSQAPDGRAGGLGEPLSITRPSDVKHTPVCGRKWGRAPIVRCRRSQPDSVLLEGAHGILSKAINEAYAEA